MLRALLEQPIAATLPRAGVQPAGECRHLSQPHAELAREPGSHDVPAASKVPRILRALLPRLQSASAQRGVGEPLGRKGSRAPGGNAAARGARSQRAGKQKRTGPRKPGGEKVGGVVKAEKKKASEAGIGMMSGERVKSWRDRLNHH